MSRLRPPGDWRPIANAIDEAYRQLGLSREITNSGTQIPEEHWNLGVLIYQEVEKNSYQGKCWNCQQALNFYTVIRCLDCKGAYCEICAKAHFGPNHSARAQQSHPG